ncbi:hypothetical protein SSAG_01120 [Streptomyces sp. Mg1]|nr:hypothetical protein SSAG_01120 [Streptomyces sp. Mg1]
MPGAARVVLAPWAGAGNPVTADRRALSVSLFETDYLTGRRTEICLGRSRHWVVVWLWFLS